VRDIDESEVPSPCFTLSLCHFFLLHVCVCARGCACECVCARLSSFMSFMRVW